jgi:Zn-dependent membrane protease YugP
VFYFDPLYFVFLAPGMLLAAWAQWRVSSAYRHASQIPVKSGYSGAEAAAVLLRGGHSVHRLGYASGAPGTEGVRIEPTNGFLSDHYAPGEKVLRLSPDVYQGRSIAALGIAAHEAGHAFQDAERYPLLVARNALVPLASTGGSISMLVLLAGFVLSLSPLVWLGVGLFGLTVLFQLVNLPVEFDASARAKRHLAETGLVAPDEAGEVNRVLNAAAWTYVAGTLTGILTLLYYLFRLGVFGRSSDD